MLAKEMGSYSVKFIILSVVSGLLLTMLILFSYKLYSSYFEKNSPNIWLEEYPRGIGRGPIKIKIKLLDQGAGLDEVVIRTHQRKNIKEILRKTLNGEHAAEIEVEFSGIESGFKEGVVELDIKAFDRSFWSNTGKQLIPLNVDYTKPNIEIISTQHNAREGGSQLVIFKAFDEDLSTAGVRIGSKSFYAFPLSTFDKTFSKGNVFVGLYGVKLNNDFKPKIFAEDYVGNAISKEFYNKILSRKSQTINVNLDSHYLRVGSQKIVDENIADLTQWYDSHGESIEITPGSKFDEELIVKFNYLLNDLQKIDSLNIEKLLLKHRFEKLWDGPFIKTPGNIRGCYGDKVKYSFNKTEISSHVLEGCEILTTSNDSVFSANDGIVLFTGKFGFYGKTVIIDHGLGLTSLYSNLSDIFIKKGDQVTQGETIARSGFSGFLDSKGVFYQVRLHGASIDPREWWDRSWYYSHITGKINNYKKSLGLSAIKEF